MTLSLGYTSEENTNDHLGGSLLNLSLPTPICTLCSHPMMLVCELSTYISSHPRFLCIYQCPHAACLLQSKGWTVIRAKKRSKSTAKPSQHSAQGWADMPVFGASPKPFASLADLLSIRNASYDTSMPDKKMKHPEECKENVTPVDLSSLSISPCASAGPLPAIQLPMIPLEFEDVSVTVSASVSASVSGPPSKATKQLENNTQPESHQDWQGETYERMHIRGLSKSFKNFQKAVQASPEQCLRYHHKGHALFYDDDAIAMELSTRGPPACTRCGSPRVFECQLMPYLHRILPLSPLSVDANTLNLKELVTQHADWGTILIYTCQKDCDDGSSSLFTATEYVAVQVEHN